jgi:hypothetical protein
MRLEFEDPPALGVAAAERGAGDDVPCQPLHLRPHVHLPCLSATALYRRNASSPRARSSRAAFHRFEPRLRPAATHPRRTSRRPAVPQAGRTARPQRLCELGFLLL